MDVAGAIFLSITKLDLLAALAKIHERGNDEGNTVLHTSERLLWMSQHAALGSGAWLLTARSV
jgi:hypothetical protein